MVVKANLLNFCGFTDAHESATSWITILIALIYHRQRHRFRFRTQRSFINKSETVKLIRLAAQRSSRRFLGINVLSGVRRCVKVNRRQNG